MKYSIKIGRGVNFAYTYCTADFGGNFLCPHCAIITQSFQNVNLVTVLDPHNVVTTHTTQIRATVQNEEVFQNFLGLGLAKSVGPGKNLAVVNKYSFALLLLFRLIQWFLNFLNFFNNFRIFGDFFIPN